MAENIDKTVKLRYIVEDEEATKALENMSTDMVLVGDNSEELTNQIYQMNEALYATADAQIQSQDATAKGIKVHRENQEVQFGIVDALLARRAALFAWNAASNGIRSAILTSIGMWGGLAAAITAGIAALVLWNKAAVRSTVGLDSLALKSANLKGVWESMLDPITKVTDAWYDLFAGTTISDMGNFELIMQQLRDDADEFSVAQAHVNLEVNEFKNIIADTNVETAKRLEAAEKIIEIERAAVNEETFLAKRRLEARQELNASYASTHEDLAEERRLQIELYNIQATGEARLKEVISQRAGLLREINSELVLQQEIYRSFISSDLENAMFDLQTQQKDILTNISAEAREAVTSAISGFQTELDELKANNEAGILPAIFIGGDGNETTFENEMARLTTSIAETAAKISLEYQDKATEATRAYHSKRREIAKASNEQIAADKLAAEESAYNTALGSVDEKAARDRTVVAEKALEDTTFRGKEQAKALFDIEQQSLMDRIAINEEYGKNADSLREQYANNALNYEISLKNGSIEAATETAQTWEDTFVSLASSAVNFATTLTNLFRAASDAQIAEIDRVSEIRIENAHGNADEIAKIEEDAEKARAKILTKQAKQEKANAIFGILLNTALGIVKSVPNPFLIALSAATGAAALATTIATPIPKFRDGGTIPVGGAGHQDGGTTFTGTDGTMFEAEKGESISVLSRNASDRLGSGSGINRTAALGSSNGSVNTGEAERTRVYVAETDISAVGRRISAVESAASLI